MFGIKHEKLVDLWNSMMTSRKINYSGTKYDFYICYMLALQIFLKQTSQNFCF